MVWRNCACLRAFGGRVTSLYPEHELCFMWTGRSWRSSLYSRTFALQQLCRLSKDTATSRLYETSAPRIKKRSSPHHDRVQSSPSPDRILPLNITHMKSAARDKAHMTQQGSPRHWCHIKPAALHPHHQSDVEIEDRRAHMTPLQTGRRGEVWHLPASALPQLAELIHAFSR